ncbi:hypothetical protein Ahy_A08g037804 [Arachis hypogaea]|uniref:PHD finger protein n=3 Tax=Arachis TaxID=3817 RepID=A0A445BRV9_ARAHY|nr:hypothetical protein Ahy_A08g037804 [Arachis hypogaea]
MREVWERNKSVPYSMETGDDNSNADSPERTAGMEGCLYSEAVNNGMVIVDGSGPDESKEIRHSKKEAVNTRVSTADGRFRTYKRRKHVKMSCSESKAQEESRVCVEAASHFSEQAVKKPYGIAVGNTSKDNSNGHWGNVVLNHLYHSLGNDNSGTKWCIKEALMSNPKSITDMETSKIDKDGQECSSHFDCSSHRLQFEANGHAYVMHGGCSSESDGNGLTKKCQRVFHNILASEKFSSLCKVLLENFHGMKPESVVDFSVINSRMTEEAYEQSPTLFLSDFQQVWRKLENTGNEIVAIAKSLSNLSRAYYLEHVGVPGHSSFEDQKQVFHNYALDNVMRPQQTEVCATDKVCSCRHCGGKADGTDSLICDSCEEMYHVSCIVPALKELPEKSWFCANCTAIEIRSPHDNCVVCERLNAPKSLNNIVGDESIPTNDETHNELEENSNCTYGIEVSIGRRNLPDCKICREEVDGEDVRICGHNSCPSKYYHVRCLSTKQVQSYAHCWYCPSCLCRVCLVDRDDHKIVLCDGCDHGYHIDCMEPKRTTIPKGNWFCRKCDAGIQAIRRAKKTYENFNFRTGEDVSKPKYKLGKKWKQGRELEKDGGMDMLLTAANTLKFEENLASS